MFRFEKIGKNGIYLKMTGTLPPSEAEKFVKAFEVQTKDLENFSVIVDVVDAVMLDLRSFNIISEFLKKNNERLLKSAFVLAKNPPLDKEVQILLERADSTKRKIMHSLEEAKEWIGFKDITIKKKRKTINTK